MPLSSMPINSWCQCGINELSRRKLMFIQCILFIIKNLLFYNKFDIYNSVSENETQKSETHSVFKNRTQVISYTVEV